MCAEQNTTHQDIIKLEQKIIKIIEKDAVFVVGEFPFDKDVRNYYLFLNSYEVEQQRREFKKVCNFFRRGAYVNHQISGSQLLGF